MGQLGWVACWLCAWTGFREGFAGLSPNETCWGGRCGLAISRLSVLAHGEGALYGRGIVVVVGFAAIHIGEVDQQAIALVEFFMAHKRPDPQQVVLSVLGFAVGAARRHDEFAGAVKGHHLKTGFGFDGFVVGGKGQDRVPMALSSQSLANITS